MHFFSLASCHYDGMKRRVKANRPPNFGLSLTSAPHGSDAILVETGSGPVLRCCGLKRALTFYNQNESPSPDKEANWLSASK